MNTYIYVYHMRTLMRTFRGCTCPCVILNCSRRCSMLVKQPPDSPSAPSNSHPPSPSSSITPKVVPTSAPPPPPLPPPPSVVDSATRTSVSASLPLPPPSPLSMDARASTDEVSLGMDLEISFDVANADIALFCMSAVALLGVSSCV